MKVERRAPGPAYANLQWRCYGAGVDEDIASVDVDVNRWSTPHAEVERPEPIPHASQTGSHADRRDRDEPFELARCGDCAWHRAPAVEEARGRREHLAEAAHWLASWLRARDIEAHIIHASSVAVSREHRRAKTDRLDTELLKRAFLGWLRGERDH